MITLRQFCSEFHVLCNDTPLHGISIEQIRGTSEQKCLITDTYRTIVTAQCLYSRFDNIGVEWEESINLEFKRVLSRLKPISRWEYTTVKIVQDVRNIQETMHKCGVSYFMS